MGSLVPSSGFDFGFGGSRGPWLSDMSPVLPPCESPDGAEGRSLPSCLRLPGAITFLLYFQCSRKG